AFGIAFLMRPETAWALVAVLVASTTLEKVRLKPDTTYSQRLSVGLALLGAAIALAPLEIYTLRHFDRVMPSHLFANSGLVGKSWLSERMHLVQMWLFPSGWTLAGPVRPESVWTAAPLILLASVPTRLDDLRKGRVFLALVAGLSLALVLLTAPN